MMKIYIIALSVVLLTASSFAELLAYEGFDYDAGVLAGKGSATDGWNGAWEDSGGNYSVGASSLSMGNLNFSSVGGSVSGDSTIAMRDFVNADGYGFHKNDDLYISFLVQKSLNGGTSQDWAYLRARSASGTQAAQGGVNSSESFATRIDGTPYVWASAGSASLSETYFVVLKLSGSTAAPGALADNVHARVYNSSDVIHEDEPVTWTLSGVGYDNNITFGEIALDIGDNTSATFDEIRIGTEWGDVVPEPATLTLFGITGVVALFFRRMKL